MSTGNHADEHRDALPDDLSDIVIELTEHELFAAEDTLEANLTNPIAAVFYVGSSALCVPHSISEGGAALGAA